MNTSHISQFAGNPPLAFIAGDGCSIPVGTPLGYAFRADGLYKLGAGAEGRRLFLCDPFEVAGWDEFARIVLTNPSRGSTVAIGSVARRHRLDRKLLLLGVWSPEMVGRLRYIADYLAEVGQPTGQLWTRAVTA